MAIGQWSGLAIVLLVAALLELASGHAYLAYPESRNLVMHFDADLNCPHCLQSGGPDRVKEKAGGHWPSKDVPSSHGLCGNPWQHDPIKDPTFQQESFMQPTAVQATFTAGGTVDILVAINAHHKGHFEFRICDQVLSPDTFATAADGQACLDKFVLERADPPSDCVVDDPRDNCVPLDPKHPGRWYLPPAKSDIVKAGEDWDDEDIDTSTLPSATELRLIQYKIPVDLQCEKCTLQWYWSTANTCFYDGDYLTYFRDLHAKGWSNIEKWVPFVLEPWATPENTVCNEAKFAEEFWNCADIAVVSGSPTPPTPEPSPAPTQDTTPEPTPEPTPAPEKPPTPATTTAEPEPEPEPAPSGAASCRNPDCGCPPFTGGKFWCAEDNSKYGDWCAMSKANCDICKAVWCPAASLAQVDPVVAKIKKHRNFRGASALALRQASKSRKRHFGW